MSNKRGRLIIISAPSGAGKGTVISELLKLKPALAYSISATTRAPRPGEENGREYYFLSADEFEKMAQRGEFLEHESYVGKRYGTPRAPIEKNCAAGIDTILEIEVQGAREIKRKIPDAVMIFIMPPDEKELRRRLEGRGTSAEEEIEARMDTAVYEMAAAREYEYTVINNDAKRAALDIIEILKNEERGEKKL